MNARLLIKNCEDCKWFRRKWFRRLKCRHPYDKVRKRWQIHGNYGCLTLGMTAYARKWWKWGRPK